MSRCFTAVNGFFASLLMCMVLSGCAQDSHDTIAKEFLSVMDQLTKVCDEISVKQIDENATKEDRKKVIDDLKESAESVKPKLDALLEELKLLESRLNSIETVDEETKEKLINRFESEFASLQPRFENAMKKLEQPTIRKVLETEVKTLASMFDARLPK